MMISVKQYAGPEFYRYRDDFLTVKPRSMTHLAEGLTKFAWSPCIWKNRKCLEVNFIGAHYCGLDFESEEMTLEQAKKSFCDMAHIIGTTKSHGTPKAMGIDRFRVVLLWSTPIADLPTYRHNMNRLAMKYPLDAACKDGARFFYPCKEIVSVQDDGDTLDVDKDFELLDEQQKAYNRQTRSTRIPPLFTRMALKEIVLVGQRNNTFYRVAKDLQRCGCPQEKAMKLILDSPTYKNQTLATDVYRDLVAVVTRGYKVASLELLEDDDA